MVLQEQSTFKIIVQCCAWSLRVVVASYPRTDIYFNGHSSILLYTLSPRKRRVSVQYGASALTDHLFVVEITVHLPVLSYDVSTVDHEVRFMTHENQSLDCKLDTTLVVTISSGVLLIFVLFISTHLVTTRPESICRSNARFSGKVFGHSEDTWM